MFGHPVSWLVFVTLAIVLAFAVWQLTSVKRSKANRGEPEGLRAEPPEHVTSPTQHPVGAKPGTVSQSPQSRQ